MSSGRSKATDDAQLFIRSEVDRRRASTMAAARISPYPVPSFNQWRYNYPMRAPAHNQWKGVFYESGTTKHMQRQTLLREKRRMQTAENTFRAEREAVIKAHPDVLKQALAESSATAAAAAAQQQRSRAAGAAHQALVRHCVTMNGLGLTELSAPPMSDLARQGKLSAGHFADLLDSLAAPRVVEMLMHTEAKFNFPEALKRAADWAGNSRAREASSLLEQAHAALQGGARVEHFNGLMATYNTCGFSECSRVHAQIYDAMGQHGVQPTALTYLRVMQSLCLCGNPDEAAAVFAFLKHHHPASITIEMYETMLWGWTLAKEHGKVDEVWTELIDRRTPRASAQAAENYMRSIVALAQTPVATPHVQFGQYNHVELKRLPGLGYTMQELGMPLADLSPVMQLEFYDAMRKFHIPKHRFYNWGRSVKHFRFMEWRRDTNNTADLTELNPTVLAERPPPSGGQFMAPAGQSTVPSHMVERQPWEKMPLEDLLTNNNIEETNGRNRERFSLNNKSIHDRGAGWMSEVPETRYDKLYGLTRPKMSKLGVRRQLLGDLPDKQDVQARDKRILQSTLGSARRVRLAVERNRTHRNEE
jgi:hypothetical protein